MNPEAIYHRPRNEFAYFDEQGTVTLLLRAACGDLRGAALCWFDKYVEDQPHARTEMECFLTDDLFAYYRAQVTPPYRPFAAPLSGGQRTGRPPHHLSPSQFLISNS